MSHAPTRNPVPEALLQADDLPTMPGVAVEVLRLCRDEDTTLDDLARVLSHDAALAARLLKFSNSSLYNLGQEVSTLQRAALVLGMKTVQLMSLSFSLASSLPREHDKSRFDYARFWRRSMVRAVAGRSLADMVGSPLVDEAFLCGLLSEIGQIVLAQCMTDDYETVLQEAGVRWPTVELERRSLGFDHVDVGVALLRSWEFPDLVCAALGSLNGSEDLADVGEGPRTLAVVLSIAGEVAELLTEERHGGALESIETRMLEHFDADADEVQGYLLSLEEGVRETSEMLSVKLPEGKSYEEILTSARMEFMHKSFGTARELETVRSALDLEHRERILADSSLNDPVTGIANRDAFDRFMTHEVAARLDGALSRPLGILAIEIDRFASVEPNFGPRVEGEVLRLVGATLDGGTRKSDLAARLEHGRFAVIMGECSLLGMKMLAERLRAAVESSSLAADGQEISVTVSIGGACLGSVNSRSDGPALLEVARRCLEKARAGGPNRCLVHGRPLHPGKR